MNKKAKWQVRQHALKLVKLKLKLCKLLKLVKVKPTARVHFFMIRIIINIKRDKGDTPLSELYSFVLLLNLTTKIKPISFSTAVQCMSCLEQDVAELVLVLVVVLVVQWLLK